MREAPPEQRSRPGGKATVVAAVLVALILGGIVGAMLFPAVEIRHVEVPVEVVKYVDRAVPFEKVVEKRVEVPVEVIKYVDRTVPVEVVPRQSIGDPLVSHSKDLSALPADRLDSGHRLLRVGMDEARVVSLVGRPYFDDGNGGWFYYSVTSRLNVNLKFVKGQLVQITRPN